jgi:hypothetical protein
MSMSSFAHRRRLLPRVVLCVMLATACDSAPAPTSPSQSPTPTPTPAPPPTPTPPAPQYRVSGILTSGADAAPIANATLVLQHNQGQHTTQTDADGAYAFTFDTSGPYQSRTSLVPGDLLGLLITRDGAHWGDLSRGHWMTVQSLPWGTGDVVQNVRLRPVRTLAPGQSMSLSVEPDSSLVWDGDWEPWTFVSFDLLEEGFRVSVPRDGVLTIDARSDAGGNAGTLTCLYVGCPGWAGQAGTVSIRVKGGPSPYYFSVRIPRASAPQRYEIRASLR